MAGAEVAGRVVVCADVGSTFVKVAAVDDSGAVLAQAQRPTPIDSDVWDGLRAAVAGLGLGGITDRSLVICSSAGGGLRLAVVGHQRVISAEAGRRVALSAGARVVWVTAGELDDSDLRELVDARPDVLLVVGGTDGGNPDVLLHNCRVLGDSELGCPVVLAGNAAVAERARELLLAGVSSRPRGPGRYGPPGVEHRPSGGPRAVRVAANVIPRIGMLAPGPARTAIREVFIEHVIGGKGLSADHRFADLVVAATPDAVLAGVEVVAEVLVAAGTPADVMALDIGGATTDVYSVLQPDEGAARTAVETLWHGRSVEGDLGMRWGAIGVVQAAAAERLLDASDPPGAEQMGELERAARLRHDHVGFLPSSRTQLADDLTLARLAAVVAARRHARPGPEGVRDLSAVRLLIGSGGVLRHADEGSAGAVLDAVLHDVAGGWALPRRADTLIDRRYLLAPIGLLQLTGDHERARRLAAQLIFD